MRGLPGTEILDSCTSDGCPITPALSPDGPPTGPRWGRGRSLAGWGKGDAYGATLIRKN